MKPLNTSYDDNKNKEEIKITFEKFPGDNFEEFNNSKKTTKNKIYIILIIIILALFFVGSSVLNNYVLNQKSKYKTINKYTENYAVIKPSQREKLFKKIGYDIVKEKSEKKDDNIYVTTYAVKKTLMNKDLVDSISVYYDDKDSVIYVVLNLTYKKDEFNVSKTTDDCNTILKNFMNLSTKENVISRVKKIKYYHLIDKKTNIRASYRLSSQGDDNYVLTVMVER